VFAEFKDKREKTPEIVKEWKKNGRRWKEERNMFRAIMGAEEEKEIGPIKSLKMPKYEPGKVGNILPTACDYKLPEDHVKTFTERKKRRKERRTSRTSGIVSAAKSIKHTKVIPKPSGPLREHTKPSPLSKEEIEAIIAQTKTVPKPTARPINNSPKKKKKYQGSKSCLKSKLSVNLLREGKLLKKHTEQLRKKTGRIGPTVQKQSLDVEAPAGKYSKTMAEYRAREKTRRAKVRLQRSRRR